MADVPDSRTQSVALMPATLAGPRVAPFSDVPLTPQTANVLVAMPGHPIGQPCPVCCHWVLACNTNEREVSRDGRVKTRFLVPLMYHEWLAYHHHIVTHQCLDRRMQVFVS